MSRQQALGRVVDKAMVAIRADAKDALAPLHAYDARHNGDLVRTLSVYLTHGCNASRAAEELYLHRSGLLYRLARIEALLGVSLASFRDRLALELAIVVESENAESC